VAKKRKKQQPVDPTPEETTVSAESYASDMYRDYGTYVLEERAIPCLQDGLKPVQRRILYEMWDRGIRPSSNFRKCAAIVGGVMSRWHPHGDSSIYDALVHLVNPAPMVVTPEGNHPFSPITPQGNFGAPPRKHHPAAAMRYTEARLSKIGATHFECIEVASMVPNFSGEFEEPLIIPTRLPLLLLLGSSGVAVGATTEIPRHGLDAVLKTVQYVLQKGHKATLRGAVRKLVGPDYGHSICTSSSEDILDMYREGKGTIRFMCNHHVRRGKDSHELVVTSFAPGFNVDRFIQLVEALEEERKIIAFNNETNAEGPRLTVLFRDPTVIEERVLPALQSHKSYSWNVIDKDHEQPVFLRVDLLSYLNTWLDYRRNIEKHMLRLERQRARTQLDREQAKMAAAQNAAALGKIMGSKVPYDEKVEQIQAKIKFRWGKKVVTLSEEQVEYLLDQKIRSMDRLNTAKQKAAIRAILAQLKRIRAELGDIDGVILAQLKRIAKEHAKTLKTWTPTVYAYGIPELELPEGEAAEGFWHITEKGFMRAYKDLPTRRGKFPEGFLAPAEESVTIVESDGTGYNVKSVYLSHGRTDYDDVVGMVPSHLPVLMVVDDTGTAGFIEHPARSSEATIMAMGENELIGAWGCRDSDTVYAFSSTKWQSYKVGDLGTKRPNSKGRKLLPRNRKAPRVLVVPKGGRIVANGRGVISPEDVRPNQTVFATGKKNYIVTTRNEKMICTGKRAASYAKSDGLVACFILR